MDALLAVMVSEPIPVPVRFMNCWLPATLLLLSVTVKVAARLPLVVGVKVTLMVQLAAAATELPQVLVCPKSPGLAPVIAIPVIVSGAFPELDSVNGQGLPVVPTFLLPKGQPEGEVPAMGAVPVPVRATLWGLPGALSAILTEAVRLNIPVGVNVTLNVQTPLGASGLTQLFVCVKSPALLPVTEMLPMVKFVLPVLVRVKL
jgi:hypothetical protein